MDVYRSLQQGKTMPYDAIWTANHLWIELGDKQKVVSHKKSIFRSPVVLGVKKSIAQQLGWDKRDITIQDILTATEQHKFRLAMTSATQSNSGASAYLGFLYAMAGYPDTLMQADLQNPTVQDKIKRLLAATDRSAGSSGWLKDVSVQYPERFEAMFNYEALLLDANRQLIAKGQELFYVIYPQNGLSVADSPLGLIDKGDKTKEALFLQLQQYLLSPDVQQRIANRGRRTGLLGLSLNHPDLSVWNPDWGIKTEITAAPIPTPKAEVLAKALQLYQTTLRKPSLTIWVLDISGSMAGKGITQLQQAMTTLLDPAQAEPYLLQTGDKDITWVIPFNHSVVDAWQVEGNDESHLLELSATINQLEANGGTDMYAALLTALDKLQPYAANHTLENYLPVIVVMTDGRSDENNRGLFQQTLQKTDFARNVPIHSIAFGDADPQQLQDLTKESIGRLFTVQDDLPSVLRDVKGYN